MDLEEHWDEVAGAPWVGISRRSCCATVSWWSKRRRARLPGCCAMPLATSIVASIPGSVRASSTGSPCGNRVVSHDAPLSELAKCQLEAGNG